MCELEPEGKIKFDDFFQFLALKGREAVKAMTKQTGGSVNDGQVETD